MKLRHFICITTLLLGSCGPPQRKIPQGWAVHSMEDCCSIALPTGATVEPLRDVIDDPSFALKGMQFEGIFTITARGGSGYPLQSGDNNYQKSERQIDRRLAYISSYISTDESGKPVQKRNLHWVVKGPNDGSGKNLLLDYTCSNQGCRDFDKMIDTLKVTSN